MHTLPARTAELVRSLDIPALGLAAGTAGGPLVAVAGLVGGAGTSTLAYTLAVAAALESSTAVLVADTGGPLASIARLALVPAHEQSTLEMLSRDCEAGRAIAEPYAVDRFGVRVLAGAPTPDTETRSLPGAGELLVHARGASALTVVDCGTLTRPLEWEALAVATHVIWVAGATDASLACGHARADGLNVRLPRVAASLVIICSAKMADRRRSRAFTGLAGRFGATAILWRPFEDMEDLSVAEVVAGSASTLKHLAAAVFA